MGIINPLISFKGARATVELTKKYTSPPHLGTVQVPHCLLMESWLDYRLFEQDMVNCHQLSGSSTYKQYGPKMTDININCMCVGQLKHIGMMVHMDA